MCTSMELNKITDDLKRNLGYLLGNKIYAIILYGSYARGDFNLESDIDFMVILECKKTELIQYRKVVSKVASRIGLENDIMISILIRDNESFQTQKTVLPFYQNIENEGVCVWTKQEVV